MGIYEKNGKVIFNKDSRIKHEKDPVICIKDIFLKKLVADKLYCKVILNRLLPKPVEELYAAKYCECGIKKVLRGYFRKDNIPTRLGDLEKPVFITGTRVCLNGSYKLEWFDSIEAQLGSHNYNVEEVLRATTAAPTYFRPKIIKCPHELNKSKFFVDGGVLCNNPSFEGYLRVKKYFPEAQCDVFSLSTGQYYSNKTVSNFGVSGWVEELINATMQGQSDTAVYAMKTLLGDRFYRIKARIKAPFFDEEVKELDNVSAANIKNLKDIARQSMNRLSKNIDFSTAIKMKYNSGILSSQPPIPEFQRMIQYFKPPPEGPPSKIPPSFPQKSPEEMRDKDELKRTQQEIAELHAREEQLLAEIDRLRRDAEKRVKEEESRREYRRIKIREIEQRDKQKKLESLGRQIDKGIENIIILQPQNTSWQTFAADLNAMILYYTTLKIEDPTSLDRYVKIVEGGIGGWGLQMLYKFLVPSGALTCHGIPQRGRGEEDPYKVVYAARQRNISLIKEDVLEKMAKFEELQGTPHPRKDEFRKKIENKTF
jgi:patatin-like phospholipase/acyl hydrolase